LIAGLEARNPFQPGFSRLTIGLKPKAFGLEAVGKDGKPPSEEFHHRPSRDGL
jgi:hypothetical protein